MKLFSLGTANGNIGILHIYSIFIFTSRSLNLSVIMAYNYKYGVPI